LFSIKNINLGSFYDRTFCDHLREVKKGEYNNILKIITIWYLCWLLGLIFNNFIYPHSNIVIFYFDKINPICHFTQINCGNLIQ